MQVVVTKTDSKNMDKEKASSFVCVQVKNVVVLSKSQRRGLELGDASNKRI